MQDKPSGAGNERAETTAADEDAYAEAAVLQAVLAAKRLSPQRALLKALGRPMREMLLKLCLEAEEPKSPKGLALETHRGKGSFEKHLSNVSYHMRTLAQYGALEIVAEEPRRGSVAHFYRPTELVRTTPWVLGALRLPALGEEPAPASPSGARTPSSWSASTA
jgi:hypothetical protein